VVHGFTTVNLGIIESIMSGHAHHEHSGSGLAEAARAVLVEGGEQWTEMRADVFAALAAQERPASAYDIAESVSTLRGKRVAANSVYRILDLFVRTNLARRDAYRRRQPDPQCSQGRRSCRFQRRSPCGRGARHLRGLRLGQRYGKISRSTHPPNIVKADLHD